LPKPNYQREKRLKDLARQAKQEEKRKRRLLKDDQPEEGQDSEAPEETGPDAAPEA